MVVWLVNNDFWKEAVMVYPGICMEELKESNKDLSQGSQ
jgi:hypothetical protein